MGETHTSAVKGSNEVDVVRVGKFFLSLVTIEAVLLVIFQVVNITSGNPSTLDKLYAALIIFSLIFFVYFAFDGILYENFIQIIAFLGYSVLFTSYITYQYATSLTDILLLVQLIVVVIGEIVFFVLAYKLYLEFGWRVYKRIGADPHMRAMYRTYQVFLTLLKLDFQFQFVLLAINLTLILKSDDYEFYINLAGIPVVCVVVAVAVYGIRTENTYMVWFFLVLAILEPAYIIFRTWRLLTEPNEDDLPIPQLLASAVFSIIMRIATVIAAVMCMYNFGNHLPEQIGQISKESDAATENWGSFHNRRMTVV